MHMGFAVAFGTQCSRLAGGGRCVLIASHSSDPTGPTLSEACALTLATAGLHGFTAKYLQCVAAFWPAAA